MHVHSYSLCMPINLMHVLNPLPTIVLFMGRWVKIFISINRGIIKIFSCERRDYESVDEKSLS